MKAKRGGFTILELSIVLIIISIISAIGITSGTQALEGARRSQTESKLKIIEAAMQTYRLNNNRLPCPADLTLTRSDSGFGVELPDPGYCTGVNYGSAGDVVEGGVPTVTLNLPTDFMYDGWGRKIEYAVDSHATEYDAFSAISIPESCGITVNDATGNPRSSGAIYALVSYGSDGHGGFLKTGVRMNTGATNTDVLTNCHCNSQAITTNYTPVFVQKDIFDDPSDSHQSYTDIVHYKERWQMITEQDQFTFALGNSYRGPNIAVGYVLPVGGDNSTYTYRMQCGKLEKDPSLTPPGTQATTGIVYTPDNKYLVAFSAAGCLVYPITNDTVGTGVATSVPNCPAYNASVQVDMSSNGYLVMTSPVAPYVYLWQKSGSSFVQIGTPAPAPLNPISLLSINDDYLMLYDGATLTVYGRSSSNYTALASQPAGVPASVFSATLSPNETYLAVTVDGTVSGTPAPEIYIWRIDAGPIFTPKPTISMDHHDTPYSITFSPDGKYFVVGGTNGDNLAIYKIEYNDVFTRLNAPTDWTSDSSTPGITFAFSKDSRYLVMGTPSATKPVVLFRQVSAQEYKFLTVPTDIQPYPAIAVRFNH